MVPEKPTVYEIDLTKKYVLRYDLPLTQEHMHRLTNQIEQWLDSPNQPFLLLSGDVKLIRVEDAGEQITDE